LCAQPWLRHNVSNTIHVQDDAEWGEVIRFIYDHRDQFAGVALVPATVDKVYRNAPFLSVLTPEEQEAEYGAEAVARATALLDFLPESFDGLWDACATAERQLRDLDLVIDPEQRVWVGRLIKIATDLFAYDVQRAGFCVKDVWAWETWIGLRAMYRAVDWEKMIEAEDVIDHQAAPACAGGSCEVVW
jgi:hypothetical protein